MNKKDIFLIRWSLNRMIFSGNVSCKNLQIDRQSAKLHKSFNHNNLAQMALAYNLVACTKAKETTL